MLLGVVEEGEEGVNAGAAVNVVVEVEVGVLLGTAKADVVGHDAEGTGGCHDAFNAGVLGGDHHKADLCAVVDEHDLGELLEEGIDDEGGSGDGLVGFVGGGVFHADRLVEGGNDGTAVATGAFKLCVGIVVSGLDAAVEVGIDGFCLAHALGKEFVGGDFTFLDDVACNGHGSVFCALAYSGLVRGAGGESSGYYREDEENFLEHCNDS